VRTVDPDAWEPDPIRGSVAPEHEDPTINPETDILVLDFALENQNN
jgi:hypothetical protein